MKGAARWDAQAVRDALLARGVPDESDFIRYAYRPFDTRWLHWEAESSLLECPRTDYKPHVFGDSLWLVIPQKQRREWSPPLIASNMGDINHMDGSTAYIPTWLRDDGLGSDGTGSQRRPNLSEKAKSYLKRLGADVEDLFHYVLAVLHDPAYRAANAGALRMEWPRIPLPGWPADNQSNMDGQDSGAAAVLPEQRQAFCATAARGRELAQLLDSDAPVPGVTSAPLRPELAAIAVPSTTDGRNMAGDDFAVTAGWGRFGVGQAVMPGAGRATERAYTAAALGATTFDIHLNGHAYWRNVPAAVWDYKLGGYQVLKKWLSYRELTVLGRPLLPEEVQHFAETARRIAAILLLVNEK